MTSEALRKLLVAGAAVAALSVAACSQREAEAEQPEPEPKDDRTVRFYEDGMPG